MKINTKPVESGQVNENQMVVDAPLKLAEYRQQLIDQKLDKNLEVFDHTIDLLKDIKRAGGLGHIVGGAARDLVMGKISKDYDVEVFKLPSDKIEKIVRRYGRVQDAGKAFGILKILYKGMDIDVSLPRMDSKIAAGHRGFHVKTDPFMSFKDAARRRDLTMNSMGWDPLADKIHDPFNGIKDIKAGLVRITDHERFGDDPLRVYRVCQFVGRFNMKVHYGDIPVLKSMLSRLPELSGERIWEEWSKMILKSQKPSLGLQVARDLGILEKMHSPLHTLDGSSWSQTKQIVDQIVVACQESSNDNIAYMLAGLFHQFNQDETKKILKSIRAGNDLTAKVLKLVENYSHVKLLHQSFQSSLSPMRKYLENIYPAQPEEVVLVGKIIEQVQSGQDDYPAGRWFLDNARQFTIRTNGSVAGITSGKDWLKRGFPRGKLFGVLIGLANQLHDEKKYSKEQIFALADQVTDPSEINQAVQAMQTALLV